MLSAFSDAAFGVTIVFPVFGNEAQRQCVIVDRYEELAGDIREYYVVCCIEIVFLVVAFEGL